jgi:CobQ-like glutamine amidotransferase family enzyme
MIADYLIAKALEVKYKKTTTLKTLDDTFSDQAKATIAKRLGVEL